mgnify:CR=1 FL=1
METENILSSNPVSNRRDKYSSVVAASGNSLEFNSDVPGSSSI